MPSRFDSSYAGDGQAGRAHRVNARWAPCFLGPSNLMYISFLV